MILAEWAIAQERVSKVNARGANVPPEIVRFEAMPGFFECGSVEQTAGCFSPSKGLVRYTLGHEYVLRHEGGHAILYHLGDSRWKGWEH